MEWDCDPRWFDWTASEIAIKKRYLSLCLTHHPDKGGCTETFQSILTEYETLKKVFVAAVCTHEEDERDDFNSYSEAGFAWEDLRPAQWDDSNEIWDKDSQWKAENLHGLSKKEKEKAVCERMAQLRAGRAPTVTLSVSHL